METYRFAGADIRGFKLAIVAVSLASARRYVAAQAMCSAAHRTLRYVGPGAPTVPSEWCAALAKCPLTGQEY